MIKNNSTIPAKDVAREFINFTKEFLDKEMPQSSEEEKNRLGTLFLGTYFGARVK